jgi:hypothetical protein
MNAFFPEELKENVKHTKRAGVKVPSTSKRTKVFSRVCSIGEGEGIRKWRGGIKENTFTNSNMDGKKVAGKKRRKRSIF